MRLPSAEWASALWPVFSRYYLGTVLVAALLTLLAVQATAYLFARSEQRYIEAELRGTFHLVEHHLQDQPVDQWARQLERVRAPFTYPVQLGALAQVVQALSHRDGDRVRRGEVVVAGEDLAFAYKRVGRSDTVLILGNLNETPLPNTSRARLDEAYHQAQLAGPVALIQQRFEATPEQDWAALAAHLGAQFAYPVQLLPRSHVAGELDPPRLRRLQAGQLVVRARADGHYVYRQLRDGSQVIRLGALDDLKVWGVRQDSIDVLTAFAVAVLLLLGIALPLFVVLHRIWRDLHGIGAIAQRLSDGDLQARCPIGSDVTHLARPLGIALNRMAAHNQRLIEGQRILTTAVSHEIRTPLSRMRFTLEMLPKHDPDVAALVAGLTQDVARLEQITRAGLSYARLGWQPRPSPTPVPVAALFSALADEVPIPEHLTVTYHPARELCLHGDREALLLALRNVLVNALRHARARVELSAAVEGDGISLFVDDDGPGVAPESRRSMFLPFHRQGDDDTGLGLGLALVGVVADRHGGGSELLDSPMGGARVRLHFPSRRAAAPSNMVNVGDKAEP